jgi:hypothetical protein
MAHFEHIFLNRALAHLDPQLQKLAADAFRTPQSVSLAICLINLMVSGEMRGSLFSDFDFRRQ